MATKGELVNAVADWVRAIHLEPDHHPAFHNLVVEARKLGVVEPRTGSGRDEKSEIRASVQEALTIYLQRRKIDDAIIDCSVAIRLDPGDAKALYESFEVALF